MDLNHLLSRHQVSLIRADAAACSSSRWAHEALANAYADRIEMIRDELGSGIVVARADSL